ncbi:hypothetical protein OPIT5_27655 [Opitutaceae bacterium TAV5]|nr:hypothetical protein OPIT5_27655 [Opitutaceae bacterium TAV5]
MIACGLAALATAWGFNIGMSAAFAGDIMTGIVDRTIIACLTNARMRTLPGRQVGQN